MISVEVRGSDEEKPITSMRAREMWRRSGTLLYVGEEIAPCSTE